MIVEAILNIIYSLFDSLTSAINLPDLPDEVGQIMLKVGEYTSVGIAILANYVNMPYLLSLLGIVVSVEIGIHVYDYIMWLIRKLPISSE